MIKDNPTNRLRRQIKITFLFFLFFSTLAQAQRSFVHPGISHKLSDLQRMKAMVDAKIDPWYTSYKNLLTNAQAKYTYAVQGKPTYTTVVQDGTNYGAITSDVKAAYLNAIMWCATGDTRYADKAVEIFNTWQNLTNYQTTGTESLEAGRIGWQLIEAAEIIKSTYGGWAAADVQKFKDMLVYPGYSNTKAPTGNVTFYWHVYKGDPGRHGNQDLFGYRVVMSMGIFLDNEIMYDRALRYYTGKTHRPDDFPYQSGPPINPTSPMNVNEYFDYYSRDGYQNTIPDYGYNGVLYNFIWENGQCQESSRDQDHATLGLGLVSSLAEMAWNQGDDVYSLFNNRILKGYEWNLRYNVSYKYAFDDQPTPWEPTAASGEFIQRRDRTGGWFSKKVNPHYESDFVKISRGSFKSDVRPVCEIALAHYGIRAGVSDDSMKWTKRAMAISNKEVGYEQSGWSLDHLGWGGLTFHRTEWMAGDPVSFSSGTKVFGMNKMPGSINAADYDFFTGNGQGRTYCDSTATNEGGAYRTDGAVDVTSGDGGYVVYNMQKGEWMSYTINVPRNGSYVIKVRHETTGEGVKLKFVVDNGVNAEAGLPVTSGFSETTIGSVKLTQGCKVLRVYVTGESDLTKLSNISIAYDEAAHKEILLDGKINSNNYVDLSWQYWNNTPTSVSVYRGTTGDFQNATLLASNQTTNAYTDKTVTGTVNQYYYWVTNTLTGETITSNPKIISWGYFYDDFKNLSNVIWNVSSGTGTIQNNILNVGYNTSNTAVIARTGGITLHAGNYPILAVQATLSAGTTIAVHNSSTSILGGGANAYTGIVGNNVYYYDLNQIGFVRSGTTTMVPTDNVLSNASFQIRLAATGSTPTQLYWIGSFKDLTELNQFVATGISPTQDDQLRYYVKNLTFHIAALSEPALVSIYTINGVSVTQKSIASENAEFSLPAKGIYIVRIKSNTHTRILKLIAN